jgi:hypothetical protein
MKQAERPGLHRWSRHEYGQLIDHGLLDEDDPVELLVADYWTLNLGDRVLEVHREPARPGPARRTWGYLAIDTLGAGATVTPLAAPAADISVADLLP